MKFLKWLLLLFTPYVNFFEWKVNRFFKGIKSTDNFVNVRKKLLLLMQQNLIVVNVWMEREFKGYKYLKKRVRRKMYRDVEELIGSFDAFVLQSPVNLKKLNAMLAQKSFSYSKTDDAKIAYLLQIMQFLKPGFHYKYIRTASFGKLLRNPDEQKLEGDCNQVVTLYAYFYSLKFLLEDLQIKLLPGHVCLHFRGIDIEATAGVFEKYADCTSILPITELISTNLLDLSDYREEVQSISPRVMVKSAQLAYAISSLKSLVEQNLKAAYQNLALASLHGNDFETAIFYFDKAQDFKNLKIASHNAAVFYLKKGNYNKAKYYANKIGDRDFLAEVEKSEFAKEYNDLAKKVSAIKTIEEAKKNKAVFQKMLFLAQKLGDSQLADDVEKTLHQI